MHHVHFPSTVPIWALMLRHKSFFRNSFQLHKSILCTAFFWLTFSVCIAHFFLALGGVANEAASGSAILAAVNMQANAMANAYHQAFTH